jgi:hypothetical protein
VDLTGGFLGVQGTFTSRLHGTVKAGYEDGGFADGSREIGSPIVETSLTANLGDKTVASLTYSRRTTVSIQYAGQAVTVDSVGLRLEQSFGAQRRLSAAASFSFGLQDYGTPATAAGLRKYYRGALDAGYQWKAWLRTTAAYEYDLLLDGQNHVDYQVNRFTLNVVIGF